MVCSEALTENSNFEIKFETKALAQVRFPRRLSPKILSSDFLRTQNSIFRPSKTSGVVYIGSKTSVYIFSLRTVTFHGIVTRKSEGGTSIRSYLAKQFLAFPNENNFKALLQTSMKLFLP